MNTCTFCHSASGSESKQPWTIDGTEITLKRPARPVACVETAEGEVWICEQCYVGEVFGRFNPADRAAIHYQMALEYQERRNFEASIRAAKKAVELRRTPDALVVLALNYHRLGEKSLAAGLYEEVLELDGGHFIANENLRKLKQE